MKTIFQQSKTQQRESGLTLVEMMVATSLLVVMMLGLTAMFNQTQRAFRSGLKQVDVFEGGRAVMDMIARDIEQLVASPSVDNWSLYSGIQGTNRLEQPLPTDEKPAGFVNRRTNVLHTVFMLNFSSQWAALGYRVLDPNNVDVFLPLTYGSLYRFSTNFFEFPSQTNQIFSVYADLPSKQTNGYLTRVADGVVHFKLNFYDASGTLIPAYAQEDDPSRNVRSGDLTNNIPPLGVRPGAPNNTIYDWAGLVVFPDTLPGERHIGFSSVSLPAMVEVELGIIEPQTLKQALSMPPAAQAAYLTDRASKIHIFRQQIPIRNAPR